jgi:hypothetical protein
MNTYLSISKNPEILYNFKAMEYINLTCNNCFKFYSKTKHDIIKALKNNSKYNYCSKFCFRTSNNRIKKKLSVVCENCGIKFQKTNTNILRTKKHFHNKKCWSEYFNKINGKNKSRSKLEFWIEKQLNDLYPELIIEYNSRKIIKGELDIFIPSLNLAFELNCPTHYKLIYKGQNLKRTQDKDKLKIIECENKNITLFPIDISVPDHFDPNKSKKFLDFITEKITSTPL